MIRVKSSALLIAIIIGVVLTTAVTGVALLVNEHTQMSGQARDGKIAYRAALSGVEDALLRYKYARSQNEESDLFGDLGEMYISGNSRPPKASYKLNVDISSLSFGDKDNLSNEATGKTQKMDDVIDINLSPALKSALGKKKLRRIEIYFSKPYLKNANNSGSLVTDSFTALNWKLVDISESNVAESQLVAEETNFNKAKSKMTVNDIDTRCLISSKCHLRIRPQFGKDVISADAGRVAGETESPGGKYIYIALRSYDTNNKMFPVENDSPGTIKITSIGIAGQARRKIEAKIDASSGAYLGLFDYGIYCGDKCDWGSSGI